MQQLEQSPARWIVITRSGGSYVYVFTRDELWRWPALRVARERAPNWTAQPLVVVLDLHETQQSTKVESRSDPPPIDRSWRPDESAPTVARYVQVDAGASTAGDRHPGRGARRTRPARAAAAPATRLSRG